MRDGENDKEQRESERERKKNTKSEAENWSDRRMMWGEKTTARERKANECLALKSKKKICVIDLTFFSWSGHKHFTEPSNSPSHTCLTDELSLRVSLHRSNRSEREPEPAQTSRSSLSKAVTRVILHRQGQRKLAWRVWSQGMRSSSSSTTTENKMRTKRFHFF